MEFPPTAFGMIPVRVSAKNPGHLDGDRGWSTGCSIIAQAIFYSLSEGVSPPCSNLQLLYLLSPPLPAGCGFWRTASGKPIPWQYYMPRSDE